MSELSLPGMYVNSSCSPSDNSDAVYLRVGSINESGPKTMCKGFLCQVRMLTHHVAHQTIVMQFILELARSMKVDPRQCVRAFFARYVC